MDEKLIKPIGLSINSFMVDKSDAEKEFIKSYEIAKLDISGKFTNILSDMEFEIIGEVKQIKINGQSGIELFAKGWKGNKQLGFGKDGSVEIERFRIFNPPILVDDPDGDIIRYYKDSNGENKQRFLSEDPILAIRKSLAHTIELIGKTDTKIELGKIGNTTDTFYPQAGSGGGNTTCDGKFACDGKASWALVRDALSADSVDLTVASADLINNAFINPNWYIRRSGFGFDIASTIPDTDNIDSAIFSFYDNSSGFDVIRNDDLTSIVVVQFTPATNNAFVTADYTINSEFGLISLGSLAISSVSVNQYNNININATGLTYIETKKASGIVTIGCITENERTNSAVSGRDNVSTFYADQTGTDKDPKLVITHSAYTPPSTPSRRRFIRH
ncbi:hypothetical protein M0R04_16570 [Candidatus Dojkabacteria bacterium]|jgi:hypothetical protein|nr:hypothetical protein [Candidatus Dojkabacteria bacterium]